MFATEETKRLLRLRVENELPEEDCAPGEFSKIINHFKSIILYLIQIPFYDYNYLDDDDDDKGSVADSCSAVVPHEEMEEESEELLLLEEVEAGEGPEEAELVKACSLTTTSGSSPIRWSHVHHRSHSDSHTLSSNQGPGCRRPRSGSRGSAVGSKFTRPVTGRGDSIGSGTGSGPIIGGNNSGYWRWRKDSATESTTSGVSSSDSVQQQQQMLGHTLSPIPSSASIATNSGDPQSPPSRGEYLRIN